MSQSRFSIVLVGVSALLRRPLVSRLRPADGERSSWVVFTARVGRFDSGFRSVVGLRVHYFRFSARSASEIPLDGLAFGFTASAFRNAPIRGCPRRVGFSAGRVGLRVHRFRFSACTASGLPSAGCFFHLPLRRLPLGGLAFGLTASAFRYAPIRSCPRRAGASAFRFGDCRRAGWPSGSLLPLFGMRRFGDCPRWVGLRVHRFRFSARTDSHRRTAEARTDGAQRHDTCFTSKHLSQHVNLPHRTP